MNLKKVHIELELEADEVQHLLAIGLDDDRDAALAFVKQTLIKKVEKALTPH